MFLNSIEKINHYLVRNITLINMEKMLNSKIYHLLFKDISLGLNSNFYCLRRISYVF